MPELVIGVVNTNNRIPIRDAMTADENAGHIPTKMQIPTAKTDNVQ